jgi:hypothetical protein
MAAKMGLFRARVFTPTSTPPAVAAQLARALTPLLSLGPLAADQPPSASSQPLQGASPDDMRHDVLNLFGQLARVVIASGARLDQGLGGFMAYLQQKSMKAAAAFGEDGRGIQELHNYVALVREWVDAGCEGAGQPWRECQDGLRSFAARMMRLILKSGVREALVDHDHSPPAAASRAGIIQAAQALFGQLVTGGGSDPVLTLVTLEEASEGREETYSAVPAPSTQAPLCAGAAAIAGCQGRAGGERSQCCAKRNVHRMHAFQCQPTGQAPRCRLQLFSHCVYTKPGYLVNAALKGSYCM